MKSLYSVALLSLSLIALSGCVDRKTADAKLVRACQAGIEVFLPEGSNIKSVNSETIRNHATHGSGYRQVELNLVISDGWHDNDENQSCIFLEEFGLFGLSYRASIYQLNYNGRIIGQQNYEIQGTLEEMTRLTDAVDKALR